MSLRARLLLTLIPLFVIGLAAADFGTYTALRSSLVSSVDTQIHDNRGAIEVMLEGQNFGPGPGGDRGGGPNQFPQYTYGALYDPSGSLLAARTFVFNGDQTAAATHPVLPAHYESGQYIDLAGTGVVSSYRLYAGPSVDGNGNSLVVAVPLDNVDKTLNSLLALELSISGGIVLVVLVAGWLLVRRGLRPLERMATTAASIVASDLDTRVQPSNDKTEVGRLGLALNTMLAQLQDAFAERQRNEERLRHFISDASHELRTPLTSMQGYAELLQRAQMAPNDVQLALRRMEEETRRMGTLVDDLLLLARLDQGRSLEHDAVDLEALVRDAVADARVADPSRVISVRVAAPLIVDGDSMRLQQVLANLLRNALVHTPSGTPVEVALHSESGSALIDVIDHGRGIPESQRAAIFQRFHRADPARSGDQGGSGLGLSIVAAVVSAHDGTITVNSTPGGGATFTVAVPLHVGAHGTAQVSAETPSLSGASAGHDRSHGAAELRPPTQRDDAGAA